MTTLRFTALAALLALACAEPGTDTPAGADASALDPSVDATPPAPGADASGPDAAAPPANLIARFSVPGPAGEPDDALELALAELFDQAVPGSTVHASLFHLTRANMTEVFIAAADRGVDVRFILDDDNKAADGDYNAATRALLDRLGDAVTICDDACIGTNINHNKFFLFSELADGSRHVVVQSSANLTSTQRRKHNNTVIIRNDEALYAAYLAYWNDQRAQQKDADYYYVANGDLGTKLYAYPRASGDTVVSVLGNVTCTADSEIHVAMSLFSNARADVAETLADLADAGCAVHVVLNNEDAADPPGTAVVAALRGAVDLRFYPLGDAGVHSKYLLIDSRYAGSAAPRRLVWTGSHNYTGNALRNNDETLLRIEDDAIYAAFLADWTEIAARSAP